MDSISRTLSPHFTLSAASALVQASLGSPLTWMISAIPSCICHPSFFYTHWQGNFFVFFSAHCSTFLTLCPSSPKYTLTNPLEKKAGEIRTSHFT